MGKRVLKPREIGLHLISSVAAWVGRRRKDGVMKAAGRRQSISTRRFL
jgi:hypothetical protein